MLMLCEPISAQTALDWGLINEVVPASELDAAVARTAKKLLDRMPEIIRYTKQQTNLWRDFSWSMTVGHARDWLAIHADADETAEGLEAFHNKRPVDYAGLRQKLAHGQAECPDCGAMMPVGFKYCGDCGATMIWPPV
jgi:enoyl-CoA hydratase/carnithine racemase